MITFSTFLVCQLSVAEAPFFILSGSASMLTVGGRELLTAQAKLKVLLLKSPSSMSRGFFDVAVVPPVSFISIV